MQDVQNMQNISFSLFHLQLSQETKNNKKISQTMFVGIFGLRSWDWSSEELARQTPGLKIKVLTIFPLWWKIFLLVSKVFSRMVAPQKEHLKKNPGKSLLLPSRLLQNLDQISTPSPTITKNRTEYIGCSTAWCETGLMLAKENEILALWSSMVKPT